MIFFIGMDDTDNAESRGTGRLARRIADLLSADHPVLGVLRHQLFFDPRVPYTEHNSSATILLKADPSTEIEPLFRQVKGWMLDDFQPGSDPGLCMALRVPEEITGFGHRAKVELVTQVEALRLGEQHGIRLEALGGDGGGVIGALAGVGLAAGKDDGRYVQIGEIRSLTGLQPVERVLAAGVDYMLTVDEQPVTQGWILTDKLRPARRGGRSVAYVQWNEDHWQPIRLD